MNKDELQAAVDAAPYWYHRIELPHGITTPGWAPMDPAAYRVPDDLRGKIVLDVGAWDGYWSIEAAKRGASGVMAIDNFSDTIGSVTNADRSHGWSNLQLCTKALAIDNIIAMDGDIEKRIPYVWDHADIVFCFGVLYHLKNPLLALENMRAMCTGSIYIETAILDGCKSAYGEYGYSGEECCFEFYPNDEYGRNHSNWHVGTLRAWAAMVEAAGFINIEAWKLAEHPKTVAEARGFIRADVV